MSISAAEPSRSTAPYDFAAADFFYSNLRIQEALISIKYGVIARKGLTVITGAGGVGKSTLLRRAAAELPPHITCLFESDPRTAFGNILRLILQNFDADQSHDEDEGALSRSCALQLRSRLEQNKIVALFLDNAHQFPDHLLRSITQHFLANPDETLLQVVLAGRPELRTKVSRAMLAPLKTRRPTLSELLPLNSGEIGAFVEQALKTRGRSPEIFDERAIKRLMLYSNGNPGAIKSICERALQSAGESTDGAITTEMIDNAGRDCDLRQYGESQDSVILGSAAEQRDLERPRPSETFDNDRDSGSFTFLNVEDLSPAPRFPPKAEELNRPTSRKPTTAWARRLALLAILFAAGAMIPRETALTTFKQWNAKVSDLLAENHPGSPAQTKVDPAAEKQLEPAPLVPLPGPDRPAETHKEFPREQNSSTEASPSEQVFVDRPAKMASEGQQRGASNRTNPNQQNEILQAQISKAIESRAIMGVDVSVVEGTAYLDGRVASERQRRAAEQAARSVAGVERVRNRIAISLG